MDNFDYPARPRALTVSELNHQVRHLLETSFMQAWIEGELSSFSRPSSGHWYFTLKDSKCQVRCAMFRGFNQRIQPIPREGDLVRIRGKVSLYENRGDFQIIAEHMEPAGLGALQQAFEALKVKLGQEGLFAPERKRPIPFPPRHIGVVTSPTGAAIHDILSVLARRCPAVPVTLYPTAVQGQAATTDIVNAITLAQHHNKADVLIIGRGGGSLEDLWCFNEEAVARAIAQCAIPTVSAVGHEIDVTIADFVADLRAPTPSAAAEKVSPDQSEWLRRLADQEVRLRQAATRHTQRLQNQLQHLAARLRDPRRELQEKAQRLDDLEIRLLTTIRQRQDANRLDNQQARLLAQSPNRLLKTRMSEIEQLTTKLHQGVRRVLRQHQERFTHAAQTLHVVSPLATLDRGYAILQDSEGTIIRQVSQLNPGDQIRARVAEGSVTATVTNTTPNPS
ncbi:exodeoxyribonuclease VII large subunit [Marinobacter zhejiangensis]|uniref:Exodeoxyribonuclease 7 large subunit n=1 Tax=Marinobacter zhejiangensis TaxID=488535 RepID=A0A1I4RJM7_9GAMM|nr:exodeoxyribonuclease VII large subunit [Marinobacter zhejiangensis]SFM52428.1 Exodeoxyribonuclease VII large subunit [Marinobacter zhejiangensis]